MDARNRLSCEAHERTGISLHEYLLEGRCRSLPVDVGAGVARGDEVIEQVCPLPVGADQRGRDSDGEDERPKTIALA